MPPSCQARFQIYWGSKILLDCPPQESPRYQIYWGSKILLHCPPQESPRCQIYWGILNDQNRLVEKGHNSRYHMIIYSWRKVTRMWPVILWYP
jgi:hypothetical protein